MNKNAPSKAFSFLEISIVIVIVGLLISAILIGSEITADAKLVHARSLTQNSPVVSISGLALWIDTTSEKSFSKSESKEGATISRWNDINPESSVANYFVNTSGTASDHPTYKESCINGLPCLYFNGTAGSKLTSPRSLGIRTKYISAFLVFTGPENASSIYSSQLFKSSTTAAWNTSSGIFQFVTSTPDKYFFYDMPGGYGVQNNRTSLAILNSGQKYIYSVVDSYTSSTLHYVNGGAAVTSGVGNSGAITKSLEVVGIGNASFQGNLGEIIIFTKALTVAERKSIEEYLGKKWGITINS